jgi:hypothetical protein
VARARAPEESGKVAARQRRPRAEAGTSSAPREALQPEEPRAIMSSPSFPVVVSGLLALVATSAAADPAPPPATPPPATAPPVASSPPPAPARPRLYPGAVVDRPAVVPFGVVLSSNDLAGSTDAMRASSRFDVGLPAGIDAWFGYGRTVGAGGGDDHLTAGAGVGILDGAGLSVVARASADLDAEPRRWIAATGGLAIELAVGRIGVRLRPEQVRFDLAGAAPPAVTAPLALGLQLTPRLWVQASADVPLGELRGVRLVRIDGAAVPMVLSTTIGLSRSTDVHLGVGIPVQDGARAGAPSWRVALGWVIGG